MKPAASNYERLLASDRANERRILWGEIFIIALIGFLTAVYLIVV
jgi:hypothetical protein